MAERWTADRFDAALASLADALDVPDAVAPTPMPTWGTASRRWPRVAILAAVAAAVLAVLVVAVPPARDTVARWFGVRVERDDGAAPPAGRFVDDVTPLAVDDALARAGLDVATLDAAGLGRPATAATPPEGGVLLAWAGDATTLWVRPGEDDVVVVKRIGEGAITDVVTGLGDYAVLLDGTHALDTPSRRVAAGRVLWWLDGGRQWRLESDAPAAAMVATARALAGAT